MISGVSGVPRFRQQYDAIVVGARVAGASTAMLLARSGLRVLAADQGRYGTDTLSTLALMRAGVFQLGRWGVLQGVVDAGTPPIRTTSFHYGGETVAIRIKPRNGVEALYAPRRSVLDALLVDAAKESGAEVAHGTRLVDLIREDDGRVRGAVIEHPEKGVVRVGADIVIGADGVRSNVARLTGATPYVSGQSAGGVVYGFFSDLGLEGSHWYFTPGVGAGAIPTLGGETLVFVSMPQRSFLDEIRVDMESGFRALLAACAPELAERVSRSRRQGPLRGFPGIRGYLRQSIGPGWALVGDAGYFKDPITAHGISDALRDSDLLARAVVRGTASALAEYQKTRDGLSLALLRISDRIASYRWDLPELKEMHVKLSEEMNREVEFLADREALLATT
jgi:2-polyprenyl-6-methoxyphenol hydroxylase-like FAD-dependent oxidoreductase